MPKTDAEIAADEAANKEHREQLARDANKKRNDARIEAMNAIADNADRADPEKLDLEDVTEEMLEEPGNKRLTREEQLAAQEAEEEREAEAAAAALRESQGQEDTLDEARAAGADDSRKSEQGVVEYRLVVNGEEKWLTLEQLRATAGKVASADDYLHRAKKGATSEADPAAPSPEAIAEARRQAQERQQREAAEYKAKLKDLYTKASMGDEQAIDELAEIQAGLSRVTPDVLRIVDERVDARVVGRSTFEKAVEWFETEYAPELSTRPLKAYAARRDREIADAHPDWEPKARLKMVGDEMRQLRTDLGGKPAGKTPATKLDRKAGAPQVPSAAGRQRPEAEPEESASTVETIGQMARARGQAHAIKH